MADTPKRVTRDPLPREVDLQALAKSLSKPMLAALSSGPSVPQPAVGDRIRAGRGKRGSARVNQAPGAAPSNATAKALMQRGLYDTSGPFARPSRLGRRLLEMLKDGG